MILIVPTLIRCVFLTKLIRCVLNQQKLGKKFGVLIFFFLNRPKNRHRKQSQINIKIGPVIEPEKVLVQGSMVQPQLNPGRTSSN